MRTRIQSEMDRDDRDDITTLVNNAIASAIAFYQPKRFYFNETSVAFSTVQGQSAYGSATLAALAHILQLDALQLVATGFMRNLSLYDPAVIRQLLNDNSGTQNVPFAASYFAQSLSLYPVPNGVYAVTVQGLFRVAAPATDDEASNPWMVDAEELIRSRAKGRLAIHAFGDPETAQLMQLAEAEALQALRHETTGRMGPMRIAASYL